MQIILYSGFSKEANSTKHPSSGGTTVNVLLKENVSVVHPVFILDRQDFSINYVQWGNRYYFVDDIVSIRNTTIELHCTVDVLATYKTNIGSSSQYVTRSASAFDSWAVDTLYPAENKCTVYSTDLSGIGIVSSTSGSYVVGVIGRSASGVEFFSMSESTFTSFMNFLFQGNWLDAPVSELSKELQKELVNPFQYIVSVQWYPFLVGGTSKEIKFGYWSTGIYAEAISESDRNKTFGVGVSLPTHPQQSRGYYLNGSPYARHTMNFYVWGTFPIDASYFTVSQSLHVYAYIDLYTGLGVLEVDDPNGKPINRLTAQCGVQIQISQINQNLLQVGTSFVGGVVDFLSGNAIGMASNVVSSIQGLLPQVETQGAMGSKSGWLLSPCIVSTFYDLVEEDNTHNGRPLMKRKTINTLSGYMKVENPDVDIVGTVYEKDAIVSYMQNGFYYE